MSATNERDGVTMKVNNIKLEHLKGKHYSTQITLEVNGRGFLISLAGSGTKPSKRELAYGWEPDYGMDHVESEEHFYLASLILMKLMQED